MINSDISCYVNFLKKKSAIHRTGRFAPKLRLLLFMFEVLFPPIVLRVDDGLTIIGRVIHSHNIAKSVAHRHKVVGCAHLAMINGSHVSEKVFTSSVPDIVRRLCVEKSLHFFLSTVPLLHRSRIDVDGLQPPLQVAARVSQLCPSVIDARTTYLLVYHLEALRRAISDIEGQLRRDRLHVYKGYWITNSRLLAERVLHIYQRMQESPASADLLNLSCKDAGMTFDASAYGGGIPSSSEESTLLESFKAVAAHSFPVYASAPTPVETRHDPAPGPAPEPEQTRKGDGANCGCLLCLAHYDNRVQCIHRFLPVFSATRMHLKSQELTCIFLPALNAT